MSTSDRRSYDTGVSAQVQGDIQGIVARLESLIGQRNQAVATAMANFQADGVSDQYADVERRWHRAAGEVQQIITLVKTTLSRNDETAITTLSRARSAVESIG
jgi:uncharacterized protein YukE